MRLSATILSLLSIVLSSCYERTIDEPSYEELSSLVTSEGKVLHGDVTITIPKGAIENDILVKYKSEDIDRSAKTLPPALITDDEYLAWIYLQTLEVWPQDVSFQKPVTLEFSTIFNIPIHVFELSSGSDEKYGASWREVKEGLVITDLVDDGSAIRISTDHFAKYLITIDQEQDGFIMDYGVPIYSVPYGWIKPRLVNGKYRATVLDLNGGFYLLNIDFINPPANNSTYSIFNAFSTGSFSNTNNLFTEVEGNFNCTVSGSVSCTQKFYCKSGEIKYFIEPVTAMHKILFKNVVLKSLTSGNEHYLNGYYFLQ